MYNQKEAFWGLIRKYYLVMGVDYVRRYTARKRRGERLAIGASKVT